MSSIYKTAYTNSWALVIGINDYQYTSPLSYACNDADLVASVLISHLDFPCNQVVILKDQDATKDAILENYLGFWQKANNPDDRLLVFFAGHGFTVESGRGPIGYLVPVGGNTNSLNSLIRWDELTRNSDLIPAKHILFIIDACYSGLAMRRTVTPGMQRFVSDMLQRPARQVITAGKADETVADGGGPQGKNSIFTGYLIEGLLGEAADTNGVITANALMHYVYHKVGQDSRSQQTPHYGHLDGDGDFILLTPNGEHLKPQGQTDFLVESFVEEPELTSISENITVSNPSLSVTSALNLPDAEFDSYVQELLSTNNSNQFNILIEKLRDKLIEVWEAEQDSGRIMPELIAQIKETEFLPAMRRLVLLRLLLIRYSAPLEWLNQIADLLVSVFDVSNELALSFIQYGPEPKANSLEQHVTPTVPALESLLASYLLGGYALYKKDNPRFLSLLFPRLVKIPSGPFDDLKKNFYLFWPFSDKWEIPNVSRDTLVATRYNDIGAIKSLGGKKDWVKPAVLQTELLIHWHSFLSRTGQGEPETVKFFASKYPETSRYFFPHYVFDRMDYIMPMAEKLWSTIHASKDKNYWLLDSELAGVYEKIEHERRKHLLVKFFAYAETEHYHRSGRLDHVYWPGEIGPLVRAFRNL